MAMITLAIPTARGETIGVLAERITAHLAIHPTLVTCRDGAADYDESALALTHILSGATVCQISNPLTLRLGAARAFALWLETTCPLDLLAYDTVPNGLPEDVRIQIERFADGPNDWRIPGYSDAHTTTPAAP